MTFYQISGLVNALSCLGLTVMLFVTCRSRPLVRAFAWHLASFTLWTVPYAAWMLSTDPRMALLFTRLLMAGAITIPLAHLQFVLRLTGRTSQRGGTLALAASLTLLFLMLNATPLIVARVEPLTQFDVCPYWPKPGAAYGWHLMMHFGFSAYSILLILAEYRQSKGLRRNQLKYITFGAIFGAVGGWTNYFLWYDIPIPPFGSIAITVYMGIVAYAILRHRLMDLDLFIHRGATYLTYLLICSLLFAFPAWFAARMGAPHVLWLVAFGLFGTGLSIVVWPRFRPHIEQQLSRPILRGKYSYQRQLLAFLETMPSLRHTPDRLLVEVCRQMCELLGIRRTSILLYQQLRGVYTIAGSASLHPGMPPLAAGLELPANHPLLRLIADRGPVLREEIAGPGSPHALDAREMSALLAAQEVELAIPLRVEESLIGCLLFGPKEDVVGFSTEDLRNLEGVADQTALLLWAHRIEEDFYQDQHLKGLGTLAAGLAHELNNPLVSVHTFLGLLREQRVLPPELEQFSEQVRTDLTRIRTLMEGITSFGGLDSHRGELPLGPANVQQILEDALTFSNAELKRARAQIIRLYTPGLPPVRGAPEMLRRAFANLIINAAEVVPQGGHIAIKTALSPVPAANGGRLLQVEITDDGPGIDSQRIGTIFNPFFSTKSRYRGLGLPIVHQIIRAHCGTIQVYSQPGEGTSFVVRLPLASEPLPAAQPPGSAHDSAQPVPPAAPSQLTHAEDSDANQR